MDAFFLQMELESSGGFYPYYPHRLMEYILCLAKHGLQWNGENANIRQVLRRLDKYDQMKLLLAISEARGGSELWRRSCVCYASFGSGE